MNLILLILGRIYNINISSYTKTIQIMQYYYAINRASRRRPPRAVVTPRTFRPCSLHAPRINTSHSISQFTTSHFRTFALRSLHTPERCIFLLPHLPSNNTHLSIRNNCIKICHKLPLHLKTPINLLHNLQRLTQ